VLRLPREIHPLKELKDDRHIHESSSYRDRLGVGIADSRKSNVSSKGATSSLRGLHPSLRCDDRKSGGVTARRNFNAGATSHDRNRTNDKRHKVYNRRDARQPLTALTALGLGQTMFGLRWSRSSCKRSTPSRLVEWRAFFCAAPGLSRDQLEPWNVLSRIEILLGQADTLERLQRSKDRERKLAWGMAVTLDCLEAYPDSPLAPLSAALVARAAGRATCHRKPFSESTSSWVMLRGCFVSVCTFGPDSKRWTGSKHSVPSRPCTASVSSVSSSSLPACEFQTGATRPGPLTPVSAVGKRDFAGQRQRRQNGT
jgi:hypothetical protein